MPKREENLVVNTPVTSKAPHNKIMESTKLGKLIPPVRQIRTLYYPKIIASSHTISTPSVKV